MPEAVFYSEEVHEQVALYITKHGGKVQTERTPPGWVYHKVTFEYSTYTPFGGANHPIYRYTLTDGSVILVQFLRGKGTVPDHPDAYWTALYVRKDDSGEAKAR
jgi:hypothetical protein